MSIRRLRNAVCRLAAGGDFGKRCPGCRWPLTADALGRIRDDWVIAFHEQVTTEAPGTEAAGIAASCPQCGASVLPLLDLSLEGVVGAVQRAERRIPATQEQQP
jgi:hypothetical protein